MIKDANGNDLTYWPISGLVEGEFSGILSFNFVNPAVGLKGARLSTNLDSRVRVWVRLTDPDVGPWINISASPINLAGYAEGTLTFDCKIEAVSPITGLERVPLSVIAGAGSNAAWTYPDEPTLDLTTGGGFGPPLPPV